MKTFAILFISYLIASNCFAQQPKDSATAKELQQVLIRGWLSKDLDRLPDVSNAFLLSGRKNEVVNLGSLNANISIKTGRQLFSKVPGVFVYDMDGSGNQLNIATRGLDPHRSWEFNLRQNGVIINSDMYGYPASHYSAPTESYERIEVVRGTGALQYGAQFGGMVNYVTKRPDTADPFTFESINTIGSYGLLSTYNAISGSVKKFSYYAYYYRRHSNGYRDNSNSDAAAQFVQVGWQFNKRLSVRAELGRSKYLYQIPGPLNDSMFHANPRFSTRARNYFSPDIYVPSATIDWKISSTTKALLTASGVFGKRNSVQFDAFANVPDAPDPTTGLYRNRQVDIDGFNSRTVEGRIIHEYTIGKIRNTLASGFVYMNNDLHRRQLGKGTTGSDYDLTLVERGFGRDLHFKTGNISVFAENAVQVSSKWTVTPGLRMESGHSKMSGTIVYYPSNELPTNIPHRFLLAGVSTQFIINSTNTLYGGISQAYRPVVFKDIVPTSTYDQIDKNLEDATGYNAETGIRGKIFRYLQYDMSLFSVFYKNRMGTLVFQDDAGVSYTYKTNIGDSRTCGIELFLQYKFPITSHLYAGVFTSTSYMHATYVSGQVATVNGNKSIAGNKVEAVPDWISRNGLEILFKGFSCTVLYNYTSSSFSDALNTYDPPASGARGFTPAYSLWDFNASLNAGRGITIRAGVNNIFDKQYFTKRPTMYPGPGIWPSDGRNAYVTAGFKL